MQIPNPEVCDVLQASDSSEDVLKFLAERRSTLARCMGGPGPDAAQRDLILRLAARVPDHRKLAPWRFIVFEGAARESFGRHLEAAFREDCPNVAGERVEFERTRFMRAPLVVAVISSPKDCARGTPKWEQELSAGAVCMNMLLAARASGCCHLNGVWLSAHSGHAPLCCHHPPFRIIRNIAVRCFGLFKSEVCLGFQRCRRVTFTCFKLGFCFLAQNICNSGVKFAAFYRRSLWRYWRRRWRDFFIRVRARIMNQTKVIIVLCRCMIRVVLKPGLPTV